MGLLAMYRDVIEEHMRSEAALRAARPRVPSAPITPQSRPGRPKAQ